VNDATSEVSVVTMQGRLGRQRFMAFWTPVMVLEGYLSLTVLLFFFGPVDWDIPSSAKLAVFLIVNYGAVWVGYRWGIRHAMLQTFQRSYSVANEISIPPFVLRLLVISMIFTIANSLIRLISIRGGLAEAFASFGNPGEAYREAQLLAQLDRDGDLAATIGHSWLFRLTTLFQMFNGLYFPLALICWRRLGAGYRVFFFIALFFAVFLTVGIGSQSGIGQVFFSALPVGIYILYVRGRNLSRHASPADLSSSNEFLRLLVARLLIAVVGVVLVVTVVSFQQSREEDIGGQFDATNILVGDFGKPSNNVLFKASGSSANFGVVAAVQYASHGYAGLAYAMELPFVPMYGLGWSKGLQVIYKDYLGGPNLSERSYLSRNEAQNAWPAVFWWSTIFPWIASDTTFYGTAVVMVLIGFFLGRVWSTVILTANPVGFAVLAQLFTLIFMFPANNALAQTLDGLFSLVGVLFLYVTSWKYYPSGQAVAELATP
jgi:hypothetical protein